MRRAELITAVTFLFLFVAAWFRNLGLRQRLKISAYAAIGLGLIAAMQSLYRVLPPLPVSAIRDWLPALLMLFVYWQAGQFFSAPNCGFQRRLEAIDKKIADWFAAVGITRIPPPLAIYLELSYLCCYLMVPLGVGALYIMHMGRFADQFWTVVLPPTYFSYVFIAFVQTLPPRALERTAARAPTPIRSLNLWVLKHASIQANTFPSAHVTAALGAALALVRHAPMVGAVWMLVAVSIAVGAVTARYHYALDSLTGAALALTAFLAVSAFNA